MPKNKRQAPESSSPIFWAPALILWGVALFVIVRSFLAHNYVQNAYLAQNDALNVLSWACFALAALLLIPSFRAAAAAHLDRLSSAPPRRHALWIAAAYGGIWSWLGFIRYCQYRGFMLPLDTAVSINEAYNFIHHGKFYMSVFGVNPLSIHFNFLRQLLSPALLLGNHSLAVIFIEDALLLSAPVAVYCLAFSMTESSLAGFCGFLLALSTPYFFELLTSNVCVSAAAVLFPWAMYFYGRKLWWPAGLLMLVMIGGTEAMPLTFFGLGLYCIFSSDQDKLRNWKIGSAICGISAAWWLADMAVIHHFSRAAAVNFSEGYWGMFKDFAPAGTPAARIPAEIISHPFRDLMLLFSSRFKFYHALRVLFFMGFLGLAAPAAMLPFLTTVFPHILAAPGTPMPFLQYRPHYGYYDFDLHEGAFMFAPLLWATAMGIKRIHAELRPREWQGWLLAWVFLISGFGFKYAQRTIYPDWRPLWFDGMPRALEKIPPGARLWVDEYASAPVSNRRWIKVTQLGPGWPGGFEIDLFKPDYVLIDKSFAFSAKPPYRDQMLTYLGQSGYRKLVDDSGVVLLESPNPAKSPEDVPTEWVTMPQPDLKIAADFAQYLFQAIDAGTSTHKNQESPVQPNYRPEYSVANKLGLALINQGQLDEAIRNFELALAARPDYAEAHNNIGIALAKQGKLDDAIRHFNSALRTQPDYAQAHANLGLALTRQGKFDEAIRHFDSALRAWPNFAEAHNHLGIALAAQGKLDEAIRHFRRALEINPGYTQAHRNLEISLKELEKSRPASR